MFCYSLQFFFTCTFLLFLLLFCGPSMSVLAHPSAYGHFMFLHFSGLILFSVLSLYLLHLGFRAVLGLIFHAFSSALGGFLAEREDVNIHPWSPWAKKRGGHTCEAQVTEAKSILYRQVCFSEKTNITKFVFQSFVPDSWSSFSLGLWNFASFQYFLVRSSKLFKPGAICCHQCDFYIPSQIKTCKCLWVSWKALIL